MKSRWFKDADRKAFATCLVDAGHHGRQSPWETFSCFIECAHASLWQATRRTAGAAPCPATEADYMRAVANCDATAMARALAVLVNGLEKRRYDFLGTFAGEAGLLNEWGGQFFTPPEVCAMIARMTLGDPTPDPSHRLTICEPAVGAGGMVLAVGSYLSERGFLPHHWWIDCIDIDARMAKAAYVQLCLCGIPGVVRHGDSLRLDVRSQWVTMTGVLFPLRRDGGDSEPLGIPDAGNPRPSESQTTPGPNRSHATVQLELAL